MTQLEFEAWVSEHYDALASVAHSVVDPRDQTRALDALHDVLEGFCRQTRALPAIPLSRLRPGLFARPIRRTMSNMRRAEASQRTRETRAWQERKTLGGSAFRDSGDIQKVKKNERQRRWKRKKKGAETPVRECVVEWRGGLGGSDRRRYQQRRDARLFDGCALRSLSEHIRGASQRSLRGTGVPIVEWGTEIRMDPFEHMYWLACVRGYGGANSWTFISSSTGTKYKRKRFGMGSPHVHQRCHGCSEHAISGRHDKACALVKGAA